MKRHLRISAIAAATRPTSTTPATGGRPGDLRPDGPPYALKFLTAQWLGTDPSASLCRTDDGKGAAEIPAHQSSYTSKAGGPFGLLPISRAFPH